MESFWIDTTGYSYEQWITFAFDHPVAEDGRLEQGLRLIGLWQLQLWIRDADVPVPLRLDCIAAMPTMFREFFSQRPIDGACFMWWDWLQLGDDDSDHRMLDAMVDALARVLQLPERHCQMSALHGLGHVTHEAKAEIIRSFLARSRDLDDEIVEYAERAIVGRIL